jgi:hypothetical protein
LHTLIKDISYKEEPVESLLSMNRKAEYNECSTFRLGRNWRGAVANIYLPVRELRLKG